MGELSEAFVSTLVLLVPEGIDDGSKASFREPATAVKLRRDALGVMRAAKAEATLAVRERFGRWCISYASVVAGVVVVVKRGGRRRWWGTSGGEERASWFGRATSRLIALRYRVLGVPNGISTVGKNFLGFLG